MFRDTWPSRFTVVVVVYALVIGGVYGIHRGWIPDPAGLMTQSSDR
jgi:uncharacterized membrane protein YhiD involved in acid resistance